MPNSFFVFALLAASAAGASAQDRGAVYGVLDVGRLDRPAYPALADAASPFGACMAGGANNPLVDAGKRTGTCVHYASRDFHGVSAGASYGVGEVAGDASANRAWGMSIGLERGALTLRVAQQNKSVAKVTPAAALGNNIDAKNTVLAANLKLGTGTAYAAYSASRGWGSSPLWNPDNPYGAALATTPSTDSRDVLLGFAVPAGATTFLASFIRKNDRDLANRDADQLAVGATYAVSRGTDFYAAYSRIRNRNGAGYTVGNAGEPGSGSSAVNVGMRHAF
jgi:predicted porin